MASLSFSSGRSIGSRLTVLIVIMVVGAAAIAGFGLRELRLTLLGDRQDKTRNLVEIAHGIVEHYGSMAERGEIGPDAARDGAKAALRRLRYDGKEYFWINDMTPRMVMHPFRPDLEGQDLSASKDPAGKLLFVEFVRTVEARGAGFVDYLWPQPGGTHPVPKLSYVKAYQPWGWVIGSGIYIDDVDAIFGRQAAITASIAAVIFTLAVVLALRIVRGIVRPIRGLRQAMADLSDGHLDVTVPGTDARDELGDMARTLDVLKEVAVAAVRSGSGLDQVGSCIMMVDGAGTVFYANQAVAALFGACAGEIRRTVPGFDPARLAGLPIDGFGSPAAAPGTGLHAALLAGGEAGLDLGGRTFLLIAHPVAGRHGEPLGTVVEWRDRTEERRIEAEISGMVATAVRGDLSARIALDGKAGFFLTVSEGINRLADTVAVVSEELAEVLGHLARGDLTRRIESDYDGVFLRLKNDFNSTADTLSDVVGRIETAASTIASAAGQVSAGSRDLAGRTEQQVSSLRRTATTMDGLTATVHANVETSVRVEEAAVAAHGAAGRGAGVAEDAVAAMRRIEESSSRIGDIVSMIDEIAFQTNLLALNAAVEAARAGDAGRGFAVVASEVRTLAQRSAAASKEIKQLIQASGTEVHDGVVLVRAAGTALTDITASVGRVADLMGRISRATAEQAKGLDEVNGAITAMDSMAQQNAALVEESSAAAESLESQARELTSLINFFELDADAAAPDRQAPRRTASG
ncbi:methyl-accepting chemotaxis protein [Skermanella mucosa]|uniref:methyl-accepting chemotaxis protein n=1 Tax=Skermanella mucosa TaxID=1789672 RepID=UPI00192CDA15|nr:methyl-accepting chemotaxis protein [Skermanella mucosa]UEM20516.1 methyl-accepting chemotaxis protein [Skermanella mucosa]